MIKYYSNADGAEEMSKIKFEKTFRKKISNSKFDSLADVIFVQYITNINSLIYSTGLTFKQILNSEFNASVGFTGPALFVVNDNEYSMNQNTVNAQSFQLSIRKEDDKTIIRFYTNNDCEDDHVAAVFDKEISAVSFSNIIKNLIKYFFALNIHSKDYFVNFTGANSMKVQNMINMIAINSLP